jgi:hypothetical protein
MIWHWRTKRGQEPRPTGEQATMPTTAEQPVRETTADDIARAEAAARLAALDLHAARERREKIAELADEIKRLNRENGFSDLIRKALGS